MTPEQQIEAGRRLARQILDVAQGAEHSVLLAALLALFQEVATRHHCCTASAAQNAITVGLHLAQAAATQQRPPAGAPIH